MAIRGDSLVGPLLEPRRTTDRHCLAAAIAGLASSRCLHRGDRASLMQHPMRHQPRLALVTAFCKAYRDARFSDITAQIEAAIVVELGLSQTTGRRALKTHIEAPSSGKTMC
jgi:hypothetical protein